MQTGQSSPMYLQYGCGWSAPKGWLNFDASPTLRIERLPLIGRFFSLNAQRFPKDVRYGDIVAGLPVSPRSCKGIYASHVLEHLALSDFDEAIANTCRYLEPNGIFRLVVPDLNALVKKYLEDQQESAAIAFIEATGMGTRQRARGVDKLRKWFGNSAHLWLWDERALAARLRQHGFREIRRATFNDSEDKRFLEVEVADRFRDAVAVQCTKQE